MDLTAVLAVLGLALASLYTWFRFAFGERLALAEKVPGPPSYPLIGHLYLLSSDMSKMFRNTVEIGKKSPEKVVRLGWMHRVAVALWNPDDVEVILGSSQMLDKSQDYRFFKPWLGDGLLISSGDTWRSHRRLIAPTFHIHVLKQFVHLFNRNSKALCEKLSPLTGQAIDAHDYLSEATVEILLETAMGVDRSTQKRGLEYASAVMKMCYILHRRHFRPWLWPDILFGLSEDGRRQQRLLTIIHGLTHDVVKKRKEERKQGITAGLYRRAAGGAEQNALLQDSTADCTNDSVMSDGLALGLKDDLDEDVGEKKRIAFLDQLLDAAEDGVVLSDKEVEEEVNTIMFEGHDTTAAASSFFLCIMGVQHDVQDRCAAELKDIFGHSDRPATFQDTLQMKYLERCIMETLRLFPPVPILARRLTEDVKIKSGYVLPESTTVILAPFMVHRDPDTYPNPEKFDPDNFLPERCADRHYYSFIPFSAGPRSCVGRKYAMLKLKILISTILRKFEVRSDIPYTDYQLVGDIILKRKEGFPLRLYPRVFDKAPVMVPRAEATAASVGAAEAS
ncbi:cytochrome P450 4g15-like [Thrips palmi]|uniref:Cytochrome P450 4g15-like n=1 Tax=Thrips palmi TaxID=161013 RepID=A0A6P8YKC6_THRPL|nr:cytochrome P450 4g15-like [Thrips palmi]